MFIVSGIDACSTGGGGGSEDGGRSLAETHLAVSFSGEEVKKSD